MSNSFDLVRRNSIHIRLFRYVSTDRAYVWIVISIRNESHVGAMLHAHAAILTNFRPRSTQSTGHSLLINSTINVNKAGKKVMIKCCECSRNTQSGGTGTLWIAMVPCFLSSNAGQLRPDWNYVGSAFVKKIEFNEHGTTLGKCIPVSRWCAFAGSVP